MARQPLGRGLSALLGEDTEKTLAPQELDIDLIEPNPEQPRTSFPEANLEELVRSIRENGIVQPIVVRRNEGRYQIVAGERRWRAAQRAGIRKVPIVVRDVPDEKLLEIALVENIQRQELNPIEEASAYRKLIDTVGLTQEMVADRVGKDRTVIATSLRLLRLPDHIQQDIAEGRYTAGHGRALLMADEPDIQYAVARSIIDLGLSVRETEKAVKRLKRGAVEHRSPAERTRLDPNERSAETQLVRRLGTAVKILPKPSGAGGRIEIEYYSKDDLSRIYDLLMKK